MKPLCRKVCFGLRLALFALTVPLAFAAIMLIWQNHNSRREAIITQVELKSAQINAQLEDFVHRIGAATAVFASNWVIDYGPDNHYPTELATMKSKIVVLSALTAPHLVEELAKLVAHRTMTKPLHIFELLALVEEAAPTSTGSLAAT